MGKVLSLSEQLIHIHCFACTCNSNTDTCYIYTCKYMFYECIRAARCISYIHVASTYTCIKNKKKMKMCI